MPRARPGDIYASLLNQIASLEQFGESGCNEMGEHEREGRSMLDRSLDREDRERCGFANDRVRPGVV